jgi:predicted nicotinamide N-methyase
VHCNMLVRTVELAGGLEVEVNQNTTSGELGATVWDCSLVTVNAFASKKELWQKWLNKGKKVLDLSCGTGFVGVAVALLFGCRVTLTDVPVLVPLIEENVKRNKVEATVASFLWGGDVAGLEGPFDVIVLSDVVTKAYSEHYPQLLESLWHLAHDKTQIVLTVELRSREDQLFFELLHQHGFAWSVAGDELLDPHWKADDIRTFLVRKTYENDKLYT